MERTMSMVTIEMLMPTYGHTRQTMFSVAMTEKDIGDISGIC